jgi:hypothetical protein
LSRRTNASPASGKACKAGTGPQPLEEPEAIGFGRQPVQLALATVALLDVLFQVQVWV